MVVVKAALSGLLPPPLAHQPSAEDVPEQPWPSPPRPCPRPLSSFTANGSNGRGSGGRRGGGGGGSGDHQWDEAFVGLLSAVVWRLPAARNYLLAVDSDRDTKAGGNKYRAAGAEAGTAAAAMASDVQCGDSGTRELAAGVAGAAAVSAVLRRLYHPRPAVRRLAGSVAVRLAFDSPSFFSGLGDGGGGGGSSGGGVLSGGCAWSARRDDDAGEDGGVSGTLSLGDGFVIPRMVVKA